MRAGGYVICLRHHGRYSIKKYTIWAAIAYIAYEFLGLFHVQGTFDVYDIIAIIVSSLLFYRLCLLLGVSSGRQIVMH